MSYGARRTAVDGRIDWNKSAPEIYNFIRAQSHPYSGAYAFYNGQEIRIWRADVFRHRIQGSRFWILLGALVKGWNSRGYRYILSIKVFL